LQNKIGQYCKRNSPLLQIGHCQRKGISDYRTGKDRGSNEILEPVLLVQNQDNSKMTDAKALESIEKRGDFQVNSETVLYQNC